VSLGVPLKLSSCTVHLGRGQVVRDDGRAEVWLTELETRLLTYLLDRHGDVVSREELHEKVWGYADGVSTRAADFTVSRLRAKIEEVPSRPHHLKTVRGEGYRLDLEDHEEDPTVTDTVVRRPPTAISLSGITLDMPGRRVLRGTHQVELTAVEAALLDHLVGRIGTTVTREDLLRVVWRQRRVKTARGRTTAIDTIVGRLRHKIEEDPNDPTRLVSVGTDGFRLEAPADDEPTDLLRTNLPPEKSRFVGRQRDLADLWEMLARPGRLVTIVGPGGGGKTRLALHFAGIELAEKRWPGGVWFVDLCDCRTADQGMTAIASALGIPRRGSPPEVSERVTIALASRDRVLLLADNLEQARSPLSTMISKLLEAAPELRILATSRERLGLEEETLLDLAPLEISHATELFIARAQELQRDWSAGPADREIVEQLVQRLDCLPLAIELAAGTARTMTPRQLLERVDKGLDLPPPRRRQGPARHATLDSAIRWSWDLLSPVERKALAALSVFVGGFTLEAADGVLDPEPPPVEVVATLCDRSLVRARESAELPGGYRFTTYEPIRRFAAMRLRTSGRQDAAERAMEQWLLDWGGRRLDEIDGLQGAEAQRALIAEVDNLCAALDATDGARPADAARLGLIIDGAIRSCGPSEVLERALDIAVSNAADTRDESLLADAFTTRGARLRTRLRIDEAEADLLRGIELSISVGDRAQQARARIHLAALYRRRGQQAQCSVHLDKAGELVHGLDTPVLDAAYRLIRGLTFIDVGRLLEATTEHRLSLGAVLTAGQVLAEAQARVNLGQRYLAAGRLEEAEEQFRFAMEVNTRTSDVFMQAGVLAKLGLVLAARGQPEEARDCFERGLEIGRPTGDRSLESELQLSLAWLQLEQGRSAGVDRLLGDALTASRAVGLRAAEPSARAGLGLLALLQGRPADAREELTAALAAARQGGDRWLEIHAHGYLSVAYGPLGGGHLRKGRKQLDDDDPQSIRWFLMLCDGLLDLARDDRAPAVELLARAQAWRSGDLSEHGRAVRTLLRVRLSTSGSH
jgi:predicted ATPase/DNA-binding response OmpR family regulator/Tfp pilus assembly protein PilF